MAAATSASGSSWLLLRARKMSAVACRERDQMMRSRGKCSASSASLLPSECDCSHKTPHQLLQWSRACSIV